MTAKEQKENQIWRDMENLSFGEKRVKTTVLLILLFLVSVFVPFLSNYEVEKFSFVQGFYSIFVFIFAIKIAYYCLLVESIKESILLFKKKHQISTDVKRKTTKLILTANVRNVSQLEEVSMIYDEILQIISLLNESFSTLLSFAFSKYKCNLEYL